MSIPHVVTRALFLSLLVVGSPALAHHISGTVYCDDDYDGVIDGGDDELAGRTARATSLDAAPGSTWSDDTDGNGDYNMGLPGRTDRYRVQLINLPAGWTVVLPASGQHIVQIATGSSSTDHADDVNFLVQGCAPRPTTTSTTSTTTTSTTTTTKPTTTTTTSTSTSTTTTTPSTTSSTTTSSTSTTTTTTLPTSMSLCDCNGVPFLVNRRGRFNNDGDLRASIGANAPGGAIQVGKSVNMAPGTKVVADSVSVSDGSVVDHIAANEVFVASDATVRNGTSLPSLPIVQGEYCGIPSITCGSEAVVVPPNAIRGPLAPGAYGHLRVLNGATLRLAPGRYTFCDIKTGRGGAILAEGPVTIDVAGSLSIGSGSHLMAPIGQPPMLVNVAGKKVRVSQGAVANAAIRAPNAAGQFGRDSTVIGCFCTDQTRTDKHITLICQQ